MKNWKLISRIATFFAVTAALITVILALITYFTVELTYQSPPPIEYIAFIILSTIMPYLLVTIFSLIVAVMTRGVETPECLEESSETSEEEALPPAEPAQEND